MGILRLLFGGGVRQIADGAAQVGRVFIGDRAARDEQAAAAHQTALGQFGAEFAHPSRTWFDGLVDGLNRLPRPILALSTLALFAYAMRDPIGFTARMQGLAHIPEPLWWIMGTVIAFYFGAREAHHFRQITPASVAQVQATVDTIRGIEAIRDPAPASDPDALPDAAGNAALADWQRGRGADQ